MQNDARPSNHQRDHRRALRPAAVAGGAVAALTLMLASMGGAGALGDLPGVSGTAVVPRDLRGETPDVDTDGLGDESQDPDGSGLGTDWEDDWYEDYSTADETEDPDGDLGLGWLHSWYEDYSEGDALDADIS